VRTRGKARGEDANGKTGIANEAFIFLQAEAANRLKTLGI
jgi:hypothetical protein